MEKKHVLGTLHPKRLPQQRFDLLFADNFEISHNWKHGSVNFYGSATDISVFPDDTIPYDDTSSDNDTSSDDDEDNNDSSHEEEATIKKYVKNRLDVSASKSLHKCTSSVL
ncbi:histone deacetylase HDT1-like isoform X2 [Lactuca sativa]|uniref:histone deacetylase HDT1-like isoform X2 n=1 Tax=Lactuca sativa TaxID=4236 RepID=UPI000CD8C731|nr:histone deacetylase HDT1-like isoform X2 [Lactuca sativa]